MEKTLYVTDMDGTLLGADSRVSSRSAEIITELSKKGALITVATARTPATVELLLTDTYTSIPAIVMTGASMWDRRNLSYVNPRYIACGTAAEIERLSAKHGVNMFQYTLSDDGVLDVFHCGAMSKQEADFVSERSSIKFKRFHLDCDYDNSRLTALFFAMGPRDSIFALADDLRNQVDCSVSSYVDIFGEDTGIIEVFAPRVSKAEAVRELAEKTGADRVVVFGDNLNDIPMMQVADVAIAVDNALPEVKEIASVVIGSNADDAVARYIQENAGM